MNGLKELFDTSLIFRFLCVLAIASLAALLVWFGAGKIRAHLKISALRTKTRVDDWIFGALEKTKPFLIFLISFSFFAYWLSLPPKVSSALALALKVALLTQIFLFLDGALGQVWMMKEKKLNGRGSSMALVRIFSKVMVYGFLVVLCLDTAGVNVTALIAGLGVGGVAIALALQNILRDLFSSLSILLDKPFEAGDFITVGTDSGTIEKIGLKTTRMRTQTGDQMVMPNADLLQSRIRNFQRLTERRIVFSIDLDYTTPVAELKAIPAVIRTLVEKEPHVRFERSHLAAWTANGYRFETVFWVTSSKYEVFMNAQQQLFLNLAQYLEDRNLQPGVPTQAVRQPDASDTAPTKTSNTTQKQSSLHSSNA